MFQKDVRFTRKGPVSDLRRGLFYKICKKLESHDNGGGKSIIGDV